MSIQQGKYYEENEHHKKPVDAISDAGGLPIAVFREAIEVAKALVTVLDREGRIVYLNRYCEEMIGYSLEELKGKLLWDVLILPEEKEDVRQTFLQLQAGDFPNKYENYWQTKDGRKILIAWSNTAMLDDGGNVSHITGTGIDITETRQKELELVESKDEIAGKARELEKINQQLRKEISDGKRREMIIAQQNQEIMDLSVPVIKIWNGIVVAPLIGTLDSQRTGLFMERLLTTIVRTVSPIAIIDITGVPTVDTQTAQHLIDAINATKLLGCRVLITGISPAIAQTLVHLGIDLSGIITKTALADGLKAALDILGLEVSQKNEVRQEVNKDGICKYLCNKD